MIARAHPVGPLNANAYLLTHEGRAVLVDPGGDADRLLTAIEQSRAVLDEIWLTHADFDHVGGLAGVVATCPVPVRLHPLDRELLEAASAVAAAWGIRIEPPPTATVPLHDGERLDVGGTEVRCLHTPGHTPGHVAFHAPADAVVLSGDALFRGSIGRTDRPMGSSQTLLDSIRNRLLTLPGETRVLPGHGPETRIDVEWRTNPFLLNR